ncbi:hypothetical protein ACEWY4_017406 [Coilia grayii]|uniref:Uncharacterized protein n=1 Tax=Coilia grayii TaxID=363190 RepID=A0ABD1JGQ6_9TELE
MTGQLKELMRNTLDNLTSTDFKRFKHYLRDEGHVRWMRLEKADTDEAVDLMVQVYSLDAGAVMVTILKKMYHNHLAADLERDLAKCMNSKVKDQLSRIRPELIRRTTGPLLKELLDELQALSPPVISSREAEEILQRYSVVRDQVTCLIDVVLKKGDRACGILLSLLKELDSYLYQDLGLDAATDMGKRDGPSKWNTFSGAGGGVNVTRDSGDSTRTMGNDLKGCIFNGPVTFGDGSHANWGQR